VYVSSVKAAVICALSFATNSFTFVMRQPKYYNLMKDLEETLNSVAAAKQDTKNDLEYESVTTHYIYYTSGLFLLN
jgi:hypothetical protein